MDVDGCCMPFVKGRDGWLARAVSGYGKSTGTHDNKIYD
jgi:hypothetical protein